MFVIEGTTITLTRGDSFYAEVGMKRSDGSIYTPQEGDTIRFALKKNYFDEEALIQKNIDIESLILHLDPSDTKSCDFGEYVYDIEITFANDDVDTFISEAKFIIAPEVI